jgi:putative ABC transport system substrate-binding protein
LAARAQQNERERRVGFLINAAPEDTNAQSYVAAFQQGMQEHGWSIGRNLRIDFRWAGNDNDRSRQYAGELVGLSPDVIVAVGATVFALQRASRTVPIVFATSIDPVGTGVVASLSRPGGNATGFTQFDYSLAGKWVDLLREIAPNVRRIGVFRDPLNPAGIGQWAIISAAATTTGMEVIPLATHDPGEIERSVAAFAREPNGGLIAAVGSSTQLHREHIIARAAQHRLPGVYAYRYYVADGGLISYGPDLVGQYRSAARYVDRIFKGEKPADLPVQTPTRYVLAINLKTAKALGLTVPPILLARADEVIE